MTKGVCRTLISYHKCLVLQGRKYGFLAGDTVAVDAKHMSNKWHSVDGTSHDVTNGATIGSLVKASQEKYNIMMAVSNCKHARDKMQYRAGIP